METSSIQKPYIDLTAIQTKQRETNQEDYTKVQKSEINNEKIKENNNLKEENVKSKELENVGKKEETRVLSEQEQKQNVESAKQTYQQAIVANTLSLSGETSKLMSSINNIKNM